MNEVQVSEQSASEGSGREYEYKQVNRSNDLLPGFYSWWGIHLSEPDQSLLALSEAERDTLKKERVYVPNYISQSSNYGNNCFYSSYEDALESYATSRETATSQLCFKVGGTLRYRHEICHVVIVCKQDDTALSSYAAIQDDTALSSYAPITIARVRKQENLVDGKVKNVDHYNFQAQYVISKIKEKNVSYENLAFAFYFPTNSCLRCRKGSVQRCSIEHTEKQCTKTMPIPGEPDQKWECPNKIKTKRLQPTLSDFLRKCTKTMPIPGERQKLKFPIKKKPKKRLQRTLDDFLPK